MIKMKLKTVFGLLLISVLITSAIWYVFAANPTETFYVSNGIYPGAPQWTIWREGGGTYYAKDANGQIGYSGTNASDVIQSALDEVSSFGIASGTIGTVKIVNYAILTNTIYVEQYTNLMFEQFIINADVDGIIINSTSALRHMRVSGRWISFPANYNQTVVTLLNSRNVEVDIQVIYPSGGLGSSGSVAIELRGDNTGVMFNRLRLGRVAGTDVGILLNSSGASGFVNSNYFYDAQLTNIGSVGVWGVCDAGGAVSGNYFFATTVNDLGAGDEAFIFNGTYSSSSHNFLVGCSTIDTSANAIHLTTVSNMRLIALGGQFANGNFSNGGSIDFIEVQGFVTVNGGNQSISNGALDVTISHGLTGAPQIITVLPAWNSGGAFVTSITTTQFVIDWVSNPGADTWLHWYAEYQP